MKKKFSFSAEAKKFTGVLGWTYVSVPTKHTQGIKPARGKRVGWGFIPARITVGNTTWESSLLPMGDKTYFVALKASVRKKESVEAGDMVSVSVNIL